LNGILAARLYELVRNSSLLEAISKFRKLKAALMDIPCCFARHVSENNPLFIGRR
jgi:hypothetical protein